jgi:hypothetical protein
MSGLCYATISLCNYSWFVVDEVEILSSSMLFCASWILALFTVRSTGSACFRQAHLERPVPRILVKAISSA